MHQNEGVTPQAGPGHQPSASAPISVGSSQSGVPNAAHTPGPWIVEDTRGRSNNLLRIVDQQGRGIVRVNASLCDTANASLISAAPELYCAVSEWLDYLYGDGDASALREGQALEAMRIALVKARGESQSA